MSGGQLTFRGYADLGSALRRRCARCAGKDATLSYISSVLQILFELLQ
jgi:hypothetical protein